MPNAAGRARATAKVCARWHWLALLHPVAFFGELCGDHECSLDQRKLVLVPDRVERERRGLGQRHEGDAARELFGDRRVDERHSSTAGDVGPHGVAGGLLVEPGFEPGGTAGPDDAS